MGGQVKAKALETDARHAVAQAAEAVTEGLTNYAVFKSGKWQAGGRDDTMQALIVAVFNWQRARNAVEQEEADDAMPQEWHDNRQFMRDTLS
jgi:hypothetical protein